MRLFLSTVLVIVVGLVGTAVAVATVAFNDSMFNE